MKEKEISVREMRVSKGGFNPEFSITEDVDGNALRINTTLVCGLPYTLEKCGNPVFNFLRCLEP